MIRFGIVQDGPGETYNDTLLKIEHWCQEAAKQLCQAVCFPEAYLTGYFPGQAAELALEQGHPVFQKISKLAKTYDLDLLIGFMEKESDIFYLSHGIFRPDGNSEFYRKTHLGEKETLYFHAGNSLPVFSLSNGIAIGFQLCVENHFPEITRTLALRGAEVIFAPHAHPVHGEKRKNIWQKYIPARSYDNRVYVACTNLWDGIRYLGGIYITNPEGDTQAEYFENEARLVAFSVDRERLSKYRSGQKEKRFRNYLPYRRTSLYD